MLLDSSGAKAQPLLPAADANNSIVNSPATMAKPGPTACRCGLRRRGDSLLRLLRYALILLLVLLLPLLFLMAIHWPTRRLIQIDTVLEPRLTSCDGVRLLLLVPTAPDQSERRLAIRETWASRLHKSPLRLIFVIGRARSSSSWNTVVKEWHRFGDLLYRPDLHDTYDRLTQKTLSALDWATRYCRTVPFVAKVDSDVFLRADNLIRLVQKLPSPDMEFILGQVNVRGLPKRDPSSRWFAPRHLYPAGSYPNYVFGAFYLMPSTTARRLVDSVREDELRFAAKLKLEDVFITGILARRLGVNRRHASAFLQEVPNPAEVCSRKELITVHRIAPKQMREMWKIMNEC